MDLKKRNTGKNQVIYDVAIIGAGMAGLTALLHAISHNLTVIIFETRNLGGLSFNGGDILLKNMYEALENYLNDQDNGKIDHDLPPFNLTSVFKQMSKTRRFYLKKYLSLLLDPKKATIIKAKATILDKNTLVANRKEYQANHIVIAYGLKARMVRINGLERIKKEDNFLLKAHQIHFIKQLPQAIVIYGSGKIAFEIGVFFANVGTKVTMLARSCFLNRLDDDVKQHYLKLVRHPNLQLIDNATIVEVSNQTIVYQVFDNPLKTIKGDHLIFATGFHPHNPIWQDVEIEQNEIGIKVDQFCQTATPGIYAIGDCNDKEQLSSLAIKEGQTAINHIIGSKIPIQYDSFVSGIVGIHEFATYGKSEIELKKLNITYIKKVIDRSLLQKTNEDINFLKILFDENNRQILGIFMTGRHAVNYLSDIISIVNDDFIEQNQRTYSVFSTTFYLAKIISDALKEHDNNIINNCYHDYYQPKIDAKTGLIIGAESLARFKINGQFKNPLPFINAFEKNGMIIRMDLKVIEKACILLQYLKNQKILPETFTISVNISPITLSVFPKNKIIQLIKKYQVDCRHLIFEVTERSVDERLDFINPIKQLKEDGFLVSMDDFSVGHSSLMMLKVCQFDEIKIDRSILPIEDNPSSQIIYQNVVALLKAQGATITAEGVETEYHHQFLDSLNINAYQGYYFAKPTESQDLIKLLENKTAYF